MVKVYYRLLRPHFTGEYLEPDKQLWEDLETLLGAMRLKPGEKIERVVVDLVELSEEMQAIYRYE